MEQQRLVELYNEMELWDDGFVLAEAIRKETGAIPMSGSDAIREERISDEAIADAYDSEERALGWYCYLADRILFPFSAECISLDKRTPLVLGERITAKKMSEEAYCEHEMYVDVEWKGRELAIPLALIQPLEADDDTAEAVGDWRYWIEQGYKF